MIGVKALNSMGLHITPSGMDVCLVLAGVCIGVHLFNCMYSQTRQLTFMWIFGSRLSVLKRDLGIRVDQSP